MISVLQATRLCIDPDQLSESGEISMLYRNVCDANYSSSSLWNLREPFFVFMSVTKAEERARHQPADEFGEWLLAKLEEENPEYMDRFMLRLNVEYLCNCRSYHGTINASKPTCWVSVVPNENEPPRHSKRIDLPFEKPHTLWDSDWVPNNCQNEECSRANVTKKTNNFPEVSLI
jgi:hypothetical protein